MRFVSLWRELDLAELAAGPVANMVDLAVLAAGPVTDMIARVPVLEASSVVLRCGMRSGRLEPVN